jgi:hypothetical protein
MGGDGGYHGLGELDRHVAQAAEADDARGARRALGLGAEVGQGRVGRDACAAARISSRPRDRSATRSRAAFRSCLRRTIGVQPIGKCLMRVVGGVMLISSHRRRGAGRPWRGRWRPECESRSPRPPPPGASASLALTPLAEHTQNPTDSE